MSISELCIERGQGNELMEILQLFAKFFFNVSQVRLNPLKLCLFFCDKEPSLKMSQCVFNNVGNFSLPKEGTAKWIPVRWNFESRSSRLLLRTSKIISDQASFTSPLACLQYFADLGLGRTRVRGRSWLSLS